MRALIGLYLVIGIVLLGVAFLLPGPCPNRNADIVSNVVFVLTHPDLASFNPLRFFIVRGGQVHRGWIQQVD